jgi:hypothetical protein
LANSSSAAVDSADNLPVTCSQNARSNRARHDRTIRSTRPGGSIRSLRHRANSAARTPSSVSTIGQISAASHSISSSSSARVDSRNPSAARICARCRSIDRPAQS